MHTVNPEHPDRPEALTPSHHWDGLPDAPQALELLRSMRGRAPHRPWPHPSGPVVLYGAGDLGQMAMAWCRRFGVPVQGVVDAGAERWRGHPAWEGQAIWPPQDVPPEWRQRCRLLVCISTLPHVSLEQGLLAQGWREVQPFYDFVDAAPLAQPLNNGWHAPMLQGRQAQALEAVLTSWDDDVSRAHHLQFVAWRCLREEWQFKAAPIHPDQRYFIPEFQACWRPGERVLDAGAHHGQVLDRWIQAHPGWLEHAWATEPDPANFAQLTRWWHTLEPQMQSRVSLLDRVLSRRPGTRRFITGQGYGSRLWPGGEHAVATRSIDELDLSPSFIKLHLEGAEWRALQGGVQTLRRSRPMLALTVYHRRDGLCATANWLMQTLPDYRWMFRLHGWLGTAAVVYGVPAERAA